jgi:hypothetical protein
MWIGPNPPLAIKLVAFGEVAFVKVGEGGTHTGVTDGCAGLNDD